MVGASTFCSQLAVRQGRRVGAIRGLDHESDQFGMRGGWLIDGDVDTNRNVRDVVAGNGHAPNEANVLGGLGAS